MGGSQCHTEIMKAVMDKLHLPEMTVWYLGAVYMIPLSRDKARGKITLKY